MLSRLLLVWSLAKSLQKTAEPADIICSRAHRYAPDVAVSVGRAGATVIAVAGTHDLHQHIAVGKTWLTALCKSLISFVLTLIDLAVIVMLRLAAHSCVS